MRIAAGFILIIWGTAGFAMGMADLLLWGSHVTPLKVVILAILLLAVVGGISAARKSSCWWAFSGAMGLVIAGIISAAWQWQYAWSLVPAIEPASRLLMAAAAGCAYGIPGLLALIFVVMREAEFGPERARAAPRGDDGDRIGMERRPAGTRMSKRKLAGIIVVCAIVVGLIAAVAIPLATKDDREITFPDPNLEAAVRKAIDIPEGPIYAWALGAGTSLVAYGLNITDLGGLEHFTSMRTLTLFENQISDISPLADLSKLQSLILSVNRISDISPLEGLTNLAYLGLGGNQISDISSLAGLTSLTWLDLSGNQVSDVSPLVENEGLSEGDEVDLRDNPLSSDSINIHIPQLRARGVSVDY